MRVQRVFLAAFLVAGGPALAGTTVAHPSGPYPANTLPTDQPDTVPHTLTEALGIAYETNPVLTGERAKVRATDENVPAALAGWRPTVSLAATGGWAVGRFESPAQCGPQTAFNNSFMPVPTSSAYEAACYNNGIATPNSAKYYNPNASFTDAMKNNRNTDTQSVSVNGKEAVYLNVLRVPGGNTIQIVDAVKDVVANLKDLPPGVKVEAFFDQSTFVRTTYQGLKKEIFQALVLIEVIWLVLMPMENENMAKIYNINIDKYYGKC